MQRESISESMIENASFQHNVWGFLELKHFPGLGDLLRLQIAMFRLAQHMMFS